MSFEMEASGEDCPRKHITSLRADEVVQKAECSQANAGVDVGTQRRYCHDAVPQLLQRHLPACHRRRGVLYHLVEFAAVQLKSHER